MTGPRWRRALWPRNLTGRTIVLLLVSLTVFHLGSLWIHQHGPHNAFADMDETQLASRLVSTARVVGMLPEDDRDRLAHTLSDANLGFTWSRRPSVDGPDNWTDEAGSLGRLAKKLVEKDTSLASGHFGLWSGAGSGLAGSLPLADGTWLNLTLALAAAPVTSMDGADAAASTTIMAIGIVAVSILLVRWLTGPLRRLAQTADSIGRGRKVSVPQDGPEEVQRLARALDAMQARTIRLMDDRTQALAAVSHDLRTPITRLRLRAGFFEDPETQARTEADLDEMEEMISATLAYLQGGTEAEPPQLTDIGALLATLCNAATDAGQQVSFKGPSHLDLSCHPGALRRAVSNLIGNAVAYAGTARVRLTPTNGGVQISVEDDGPGIPEAELERVFEPFFRMEASRNRSTGGVGLGLTIARQVVVEQGGSLTLSNQLKGGLRAVIHLPQAGPRSALGDKLGPGKLGFSQKENPYAST